jgi:hypothetical protein
MRCVFARASAEIPGGAGSMTAGGWSAAMISSIQIGEHEPAGGFKNLGAFLRPHYCQIGDAARQYGVRFACQERITRALL